MSQKSKTRKTVRFSETPLIRQYSKDYSEDRKANSQTADEHRYARYTSRAEAKEDKLTRQLAKEEEERKKTRPEDTIQITRSPTVTFSVRPEPNSKNKGAWHKFKKMTGITKSSKGGKTRRTRTKTRRIRTRRNKYY
jgi:hypothetical protein